MGLTEVLTLREPPNISPRLACSLSQPLNVGIDFPLAYPKEEDNLAHIFISYIHENKDIVDKLANELRNRGVTVWLDRNDIDPGVRWRNAISEAIHSGSFFVACF